MAPQPIPLPPRCEKQPEVKKPTTGRNTLAGETAAGRRSSEGTSSWLGGGCCCRFLVNLRLNRLCSGSSSLTASQLRPDQSGGSPRAAGGAAADGRGRPIPLPEPLLPWPPPPPLPRRPPACLVLLARGTPTRLACRLRAATAAPSAAPASRRSSAEGSHNWQRAAGTPRPQARAVTASSETPPAPADNGGLLARAANGKRTTAGRVPASRALGAAKRQSSVCGHGTPRMSKFTRLAGGRRSWRSRATAPSATELACPAAVSGQSKGKSGNPASAMKARRSRKPIVRAPANWHRNHSCLAWLRGGSKTSTPTPCPLVSPRRKMSTTCARVLESLPVASHKPLGPETVEGHLETQAAARPSRTPRPPRSSAGLGVAHAARASTSTATARTPPDGSTSLRPSPAAAISFHTSAPAPRHAAGGSTRASTSRAPAPKSSRYAMPTKRLTWQGAARDAPPRPAMWASAPAAAALMALRRWASARAAAEGWTQIQRQRDDATSSSAAASAICSSPLLPPSWLMD
mmetsp:Transcript_175380/g.562605  ORF Transcript_175380/g.562605 Transcript_175380/m.562605 type:complete len:518 (-) Transcript_175380:966-2519(-)